MLGVDGDNDWIIKYSTDTFTEVDRIAVDNDPHVSYSPDNDQNFAPTQGGNVVSVIAAATGFSMAGRRNWRSRAASPTIGITPSIVGDRKRVKNGGFTRPSIYCVLIARDVRPR